MERHLKQLPQEILDLVYHARDTAAEQGQKAFLIGGFVRDLILGVRNYDLDICVEGDGVLFAQRFAEARGWWVVVHRRFRTATVVTDKHHKIDIATARCESYPHPASLPVVSPGTLQDDLKRRDFTINTMAIDLDAQSFGSLIDMYHGKKDLTRRTVRILHDRSFVDDPTRILRAIRFEQRMGFSIEPHTMRRLRAAVKDSMMEAVQPHRMRDEIVLMLKEARPLRQIRRIEELTGFGFVSKSLRMSRGKYALLSQIQGQLEWFHSTFESHRKLDGWLVYLMGLLDGLTDEAARHVLERFAFHKGETKRLRSYFESRLRVEKALGHASLAASGVFHVLEPLSYEVILACRARTKDKRVSAYIGQFLSCSQGVKLYVSGHDLKDLGVPPGPRYQAIIRELLNAVIDGKVAGRQQELDFVRQIVQGR